MASAQFFEECAAGGISPEFRVQVICTTQGWSHRTVSRSSARHKHWSPRTVSFVVRTVLHLCIAGFCFAGCGDDSSKSETTSSKIPLYNQWEITERTPPPNPEGTLAAWGWARRTLMEYDGELIPESSRDRLKEWDFYTVSSARGCRRQAYAYTGRPRWPPTRLAGETSQPGGHLGRVCPRALILCCIPWP